MWRDVKDAIRGFWRAPGFTAAAVVALGVAVGANATIFSLVDGLWLRPPGVANPGRLVHVFQTTQTAAEGLWSYPEFEAVRDRAARFGDVVAVGRRGAVLTAPDGTSELLLVNVVSPDFFRVLGVTAAYGRLFSAADAAALDAEPGVVLGHAFWRRRFGADPAVVGRRLSLGGRTPVTVLGVLPEQFREIDPSSDRDLWMPGATWAALHGPEDFSGRSNRWFALLAVLHDRVSPAQADAGVAAAAAALATDWPDTNTARGARVVSDAAYRWQGAGANVYTLMGLVLLVVLITCVNLAHLLLARAAGRRRELAVRAALGAGRRRLLRQLLVESAVLGLLGAGVGLLIAAWLIRALPWFLVPPPGFGSFEVFQADARVVLFTLAVTSLTTLLFAVVPAVTATRTNVAALIKGDVGLTGSARVDRRLGRGLVVAQIAVSLALVYSAAVLAASFRAVDRMDLGFSRAPVLTAWIPSYGRVPAAVVEEAAARVRALPGVAGVAVAIRAPLSLSGGGLSAPVVVPGREPEAGAPPDVKYGAVDAGYFPLMGIPIVRGRAFSDAESHGGEPVVVVNQAFADRFFPGVDPIGRTIRPGAGANAADHRIVGITTNAVIQRIDEPIEPYFYVPYWRESTSEGTLFVRPSGSLAGLGDAVRQTLRGVDPRLDPRFLVTMDEYVAFGAGLYRTTAALAGTLSIIGLLLLAVGIYGVVTYQLTRRTREIGVRIAIGATRGQVLRLVLGDSGRLVLLGVAVGVPLALAAGWAMTSLLFGVGPWSWPALVVAAAVLSAAVIAATLVPAWRATRLSPMTALRES